MGNIIASSDVTNALFSKVQQRVMALLFREPDRSFYTSEILRQVGCGVGAVDRELSRLQGCGLLTVERIGRQKHYRANRNAPVFDDLRSLLEKTINVTAPLKNAFDAGAGNIRSAFVFGSVAKGSDTANSDVDILVIGDDLDYARLYAAVHEAEAALKRPVHPLFMSPRDWKRRSAEHGSVMRAISEAPKLFFIGSEEELRRV